MSDMSWLGLDGKTCVVTGAGGGIGCAVAVGLARAGARLALLDRDAESLAETARQVGASAVQAAIDVTDEAAVAEAAATISDRFGGTVDVLVNNAGIGRSGTLAMLTLAQWNEVIAVNLTGYFLCARAFGALMRGGGAMVHVASVAARHPIPGGGAYAVAKAGVVMLSRQWALEGGPAGIRSNVISPGLVVTPMSQRFYDDPASTAARAAVIPAGRIATPEDVADAVLFLAGTPSRYVSGDEIVVDGGFTRGLMGLIPRPDYAPEPAG